jgi:hypothetical protein
MKRNISVIEAFKLISIRGEHIYINSIADNDKNIRKRNIIKEIEKGCLFAEKTFQHIMDWIGINWYCC